MSLAAEQPAAGARSPRRYRALGAAQLPEIARRYGLPADVVRTIRLHATVLPFRVNEYVLDELIDWSAVPEDPLYQLLFPQPGMLPDSDLAQVAHEAGPHGSPDRLRATVAALRARLNPHPAAQLENNVPHHLGVPLPGLQHKYAHTVLYFPSQGQTCHAYCTYCFRWAQFVGDADLRFAAADPSRLVAYLGEHPEVSDVLFTGGDPMIMAAMRLRAHVDPLLEVDTVRTVRIGTRSLSHWPARFTTDPDAADLLRLFERVVASGRTLAVMAHLSHPRELATEVAREAIGRIRATGAMLYGQAPLMARVNDDALTWSALWRAELAAGVVPYYQFVARDTGPQDYFAVPLAQAWGIFTGAAASLSGLARTVRGPVMSTTSGKVVIDHVTTYPDRDPVFHLRFLQARDPRLVGRPFRAVPRRPDARWIDDLEVLADTSEDLGRAVRGAAEGPGRGSAGWATPARGTPDDAG